MSDTPNEPGPDDSAGSNDGDIKALREAAKAGKADRAENEQLKRELAFAKAGVDTESKLGGMLSKTYEGDLNDIDALKAEWAELNPTQGSAGDEAPSDAPVPEGFQDPSQQQQHRDQLAGQAAGDAPKETIHPVDAAFEQFHANKALPMEDRQEAAMAHVLGAYFQGDSRVMFDRNAHLAAAQSASRDDVDPG